MADTKDTLAAAVAEIVKDYREGEIAPVDDDHVRTWIEQFPELVQVPILAELSHVFKTTYFPRTRVEQFLAELLKTPKLAGEDPCAFWRQTNFLEIQAGGNSQHEMLAMFGSILKDGCGISLADCGSEAGAFVYLDDAIFTGNRCKRDLSEWVTNTAPQKTHVHIVTIATHRGGQWYADGGIRKAATAVKKSVEITWWSALWVEDRKNYLAQSNVLRPTHLPDDADTVAYAQTLTDAGYAPVFRKTATVKDHVFSSQDARELLEQEFLKAGVHVKNIAPFLPENCRPLGYSVLKILGFGSMIVTFRNCPNNCPLVLWAGDPWYPLFPRKTN
jgi:hypothetical protein